MTKFELPKLAYENNSLEPHIDTMTMEIHYSKHHAAYVNNLNLALEKHPEVEYSSLEELLKNIENLPREIQIQVKNNAGGHYNHSMFWAMLTPNSKQKPSGDLAKRIDVSFGDFEKFKAEFAKVSLGRFGSGWAWLTVNKADKLEILSTSNQNNLITDKIDSKALLCLDVWEHAYYLKYQNRRADYVNAFWNVVNWDEVERLYSL